MLTHIFLLLYVAVTGNSSGCLLAVLVNRTVMRHRNALTYINDPSALYRRPNASSGAAANWTESFRLPDAVPGSGRLSLTAGAGHLPSVLAQQRAVLDAARDRTYLDAYSALAMVSMPSVSALYKRNVPLGDRPAVARAFADLQGPLSSPRYGLLFSAPRAGAPPPDRADARLNFFAAWVAGALPAPGDGEAAGQWAPLQAAAGGWRRAAARQLVDDANEASNKASTREFKDLETLAWAQLALGPGWAPPACGGDNSSSAAQPQPEVAQPLAGGSRRRRLL